jgi:hypothetical protein
MLTALILSAALQATAPADGVGAFRALCVDTAGDVNRVASAVAAQGGWTTPARNGDVFIWSRKDDPTSTLVAGPQDGRFACMLTLPELAGVDAALSAGLGPYFGSVGEGGLFVFAPSSEAFERRDLTFIQTSTTNGKTTLTAIKPQG